MIGDNIRKRIDELRISVAQAAKRCEIPAGTMYTYITDKREPTASRLKKIADGLNVTIDSLLKETESGYPATDELRKNPTAGFVFDKGDFYDKLNPEGKKLLEGILQLLKQGYEKK